MALTRPRLGQFNTTVSSLSDPITVLHAGASSANVDVGFLMNRANGLVSNVALYWNESGNTFVTAFTTSTGTTDSNISPIGYANLTVGTLTANTLSVAGGGINGVVIGAITPAAGTFTALTASGIDLVANAASQATSINTINTNIIGINANLGAYQTYANTSIGSINANITAANTAIQTLTTNLGTLVAGAPAALDTLAEIDAALNNNASFGAVIVTWLGNITANVTTANTNISSITANLGAYQTYANTTSADQLTAITSLATGANTNTAAYLSGSVSTGTLVSTNFSTSNAQITGGSIKATGNIVAGSGTASTSKTTGALVVTGGVGIAGDVNIGTSLTVDNGSYGNVTTTQFGSVFATAYGPNNYSIIQAWSPANGGGLGFNAYGNIVYSGGAINFKTGATVRDKDFPTGGTTGVQIAANGAIVAQSAISSTTPGTGALIVNGGVGISGNINTAGNIYANTAGTTTTVANLVTTAGIFWANGTAFVSGTGGLSFPTDDYGNLTDSVVDAFGAKSVTTFDLNTDGAITVTDLGTM